MQLHPSTAFEAELAYRRERIAADFERTGGRPRRSRTGGSDRRRWHRRPDRTTT